MSRQDGQAAAVVVNGRCLHRPITGVERYASEVLARLKGQVTVLGQARGADGMRGHAWEQIRLPSLVGGALLWSPANTGPLTVTRQVVTIHDVSPLDHPEWFHPAFAAWYRFLLPRLARRVRRIITDSLFSKARILERLSLPDERVHAIPCGVDARFAPAPAAETEATAREHGLRRPFVLTVGSLQPRKNLRTLLRAWTLVRRLLPDVELVIAGTGRANFASPGVDGAPAGVRFLGFVQDRALPALYTAARSVVVPSLYEGFGLTALEAMACGTPVVVASGTALAELAGTAALSVDARSAESIAEGIERTLTDTELRSTLRQRGLELAHRYTWEQTTEQTWHVLSEAADG